jgi:hypothetical protein
MKPRRKPAKKFKVVTDSEGGLPLPSEWGAKIGDEFATWKEGDKIILVFPKTYRGNRRIPKGAHRGKVEPALPELQIAVLKAKKA